MDDNISINESVKKSYKKLSIIVSLLLITSAIVYIVFQFITNGTIKDILFVSLTIFESLFILYAGWIMIRYIESKGFSFYTSLKYFTEIEQPEKEINNLIGIFQNFKKTWPLIFIWAIGVFIFTVYKDCWENNITLNLLFGIFLFFTNIITAYGIILLYNFIKATRKMWFLIKVELWNRENPAAKFIFSVSKRIAIIGAVYMTSSFTAWNTSEVTESLGNEIIIILIFSVIILFVSIVIPILPFINRIVALKNMALSDIDTQIQLEYNVLKKSFNKAESNIQFEKMNELIEMRKRIVSIQVFPFQLKTILASLSIIIISLLPKAVELILITIFQ